MTLFFQALKESLRTPLHILRRLRLGGLRVHLLRLRHQSARLLFGIRALAAPAPLVGFALLEVGLPPHVVNIKRGAVSVQVPHRRHHLVKQIYRVRNNDETARVGLQIIA